MRKQVRHVFSGKNKASLTGSEKKIKSELSSVQFYDLRSTKEFGLIPITTIQNICFHWNISLIKSARVLKLSQLCDYFSQKCAL